MVYRFLAFLGGFFAVSSAKAFTSSHVKEAGSLPLGILTFSLPALI
jgi:hypothetical protein